MKITNNKKLPTAIVNAIKSHHHQGGFISASKATVSPREFWLSKRHHGEFTEDASNMIWALFGTAFHAIVEQGS